MAPVAPDNAKFIHSCLRKRGDSVRLDSEEHDVISFCGRKAQTHMGVYELTKPFEWSEPRIENCRIGAHINIQEGLAASNESHGAHMQSLEAHLNFPGISSCRQKHFGGKVEAPRRLLILRCGVSRFVFSWLGVLSN